MGIKVNLISLGCSKNLVDSEWMQGILDSRGYEIVGVEEKAEVTIINTCAFITPAKEEAIETIFDTVRRKISGKTQAIVVAGCLAQRYGSVLLEEIPEIDGVMGTGAIPQISQVVTEVLQGERPCRVAAPAFSYQQELPRQLSLPFYSAYLKIADGCSNCCSY
ncbi:MAG: 30S ribosomal protein S12 methylthiotransferase RimO, partial [Clostridia bacterium]|nr:30S ribosomal protein S12 methylthiotransferase RimO [Clostridia bacterium]